MKKERVNVSVWCVCVCGRICMVPGSRLDTSQDRRQTVSARGIISRARGNFTDREQTRFSSSSLPSLVQGNRSSISSYLNPRYADVKTKVEYVKRRCVEERVKIA